MFVRVSSLSPQGLLVHDVTVEVNVGRGLPGTVIVGLPDKAVMESRDRVKTAVTNTNQPWPRARVTVNLAPGDLQKEGSLYDLPIAAGVMVATEIVPAKRLENLYLVGELSLDGRLCPVRGVLNMARCVRDKGGVLALPADNYREAALVEGLDILALETLDELIRFLATGQRPALPPEQVGAQNEALYTKDFVEVRGQVHAKRALALAAAGGHNVLMLGPPGSGKSMLAERFPSIFPPLVRDEALEITAVHSIAGQLNRNTPMIERRPFRAPHHTISEVALIGGGSMAKPGEISLAHGGVLYLDELPEFRRSTLEVLRQPLENGSITIGRAKQVADYPAQFTLIAAMNPCPCGYYGSRLKKCRCSSVQVERYVGRISGPFLDRIDIHLEVADQPLSSLRSKRSSPDLSTKDLKELVMKAVARQQERYKGTAILRNGQLRASQVERYCKLDKECEDFLVKALEEMGLSGRAYHKVCVLSRTIADMEGGDMILMSHVAEALNYRGLDQKFFSA